MAAIVKNREWIFEFLTGPAGKKKKKKLSKPATSQFLSSLLMNRRGDISNWKLKL